MRLQCSAFSKRSKSFYLDTFLTWFVWHIYSCLFKFVCECGVVLSKVSVSSNCLECILTLTRWLYVHTTRKIFSDKKWQAMYKPLKTASMFGYDLGTSFSNSWIIIYLCSSCMHVGMEILETVHTYGCGIWQLV